MPRAGTQPRHDGQGNEMNWPTDTLAGIYLSLFAFGLLFSVASLVLGAAHGHLHLPGGHHVGHGGHLDQGTHAGHVDQGAHGAHGAHSGHAGETSPPHHSASATAPSPVNVSTVMIFLTWFGATGYIVRVYYGALPAFSLLLAALTGLLGAWLLYLFLARVLWRGQTELDPANYHLIGALARVSSPIRAGGTGEIVYALDGKQRVDAARSADGSPLPLGAEVVIARYECGIAYVESQGSWIARIGATADAPFIGEPLDHPPPGRTAR